MDRMEVIRRRRSVRTFDGKMISPGDLEALCEYIETIENPYGIPVRFVLLDRKECGLSTPVISGEPYYIAAAVGNVPHSEEAFGYAFEEMVLYAWSLGIGTTWIGGTMKRTMFEQAAGLEEDERMYCISPLGYPAAKMSLKEFAMRKGVGADRRKPASELFFDRDTQLPLQEADPDVMQALEAVRLAPSAVNGQPWRIVRDADSYHFYEKHKKGYGDSATGDIQKVDMGIALNHFMSFLKCRLVIDDPGISMEEGTEYIATVNVIRE